MVSLYIIVLNIYPAYPKKKWREWYTYKILYLLVFHVKLSFADYNPVSYIIETWKSI